jgi:hypothetical protein
VGLERLLNRAIRRAPAYGEWVQAMFELRFCPGSVELGTLEAMATEAHQRVRSPLRFPPPRLLATRNGFPALRRPGMFVLAAALGGLIYYRPDADRLRLAFAVYHELAEAILARSGIPHNHTDVQVLTLMLLVPRDDVVSILRRMGSRAGTSWLCRHHRWAPAWALRWRVALIYAAAEAA